MLMKIFLRVKLLEKYEYDLFIKAGFLDIDEGKKRINHTGKNGTSNRKTKNFKFHNYHGVFELNDLKENPIIIKVPDVKNTELRKKLTENMYLITNNADFNDSIELDELESLINMDKTLMTNKGILTLQQILILSDRFGIKTNNNSYYESDITERWMNYFYNYHDYNLIVRFDDTQDSKILKTVIKIKQNETKLYSDNIDFYQMKRDKDNKIYEDWENSITDKNLKVLLNSTNPKYNEDIQKVLTDLQKDLNKK